MTSDIEALRSEVSRLTRERDSLLVAIGEHVTVRSDQYAQIQRLQAALERWSHDGHLQTFEDRERFRAEARALLSGEPGSAPETAAKPTDSELYSSSELFRHIWVCPMGWIGDKLIYGPGYTSADMKPWLVKLRRLVGFEHPEGTPLEQPEKACEDPTDVEKRAMGVDLDSRDHEAR